MSTKRGRYMKTAVEEHGAGFRYRKAVPLDILRNKAALADHKAEIARDAVITSKLARLRDDTGGAFTLVDLWQRVKPPRNHKTADKMRLYVRRFAEEESARGAE